MTIGAQEPISGMFYDFGGWGSNLKHIDNGFTSDGTSVSLKLSNLAAGFYLLPPGNYTLGENAIVPEGVTIQMAPGAVFTGAFILTVNGDIVIRDGGTHFNGGISVLFTATSDIPSVNVKWFGAKADNGATDNVVPITKAIQSLKDRGGEIFFPSGFGSYYGVSDAMMFLADNGYSNIVLRGEGNQSWVKHTVDWADGGILKTLFFFQGENIYELKNFRVTNMRISGNSEADLTQILGFGNCDGVVIDHVFFDQNGREGIYFNAPRDTKNVRVENCYGEYIGNTYFGGLSALNLNAINAHCHNNTLYNVGQGIEHTGYGLNVTGNNFSKCKVYGMLLMSTWSGWLDSLGVEQNSQRAVIDGNIIDDAAVGILFGDAGGRTFGGHDYSGNLGKVIISNNVFTKNNQAVNVGADNGAPVLIQGNIFYDSRDSSQSACVSGGGNGPVVIKGNTFQRGPNFQWAYLVRNLSTENLLIFENNLIVGQSWTTGAIWNARTKCSIRENSFISNGDVFGGFALRFGSLAGGFQQVSFNTPQLTQTRPFSYSSELQSNFYCYADPDSLTWKKGDVLESSDPDTGEWERKRCTAEGTAGTLNAGATTGSINNGAAVLTVSALTGLYVGAMLTIAGVSGTKKILSIDEGLLQVTLDSNADATVAGAAVAYKAPTFKIAATMS